MRLPLPVEEKFIRQHLDCDVKSLALDLAKHQQLADLDRQLVIEQIAGLQLIKKKIPSWYDQVGIVVPPRLPLEQCSSEATARYKASLFKGLSLCDLTGGFGVDFAFLARNFSHATYVETQSDLCLIMQHNAKMLGLSTIDIVNDDLHNFLQRDVHYSCIYLDPARRKASGQKAICLDDCQPDITALYHSLLQRCERLVVKLSPMMDIARAMVQLPQTADIHVIALENECKELLFVGTPQHDGECKIHCINLLHNAPPQVFEFKRAEEHDAICDFADEPQLFLYEPNAAIMKAGAFRLVAQLFCLRKLHQHSHLYTSNELADHFPGRVFRVLDWFGAGRNEVGAHLHDLKQANVSVRNFFCSAQELRKRLKINDGGNFYLFATTLSNNRYVLIKTEKYS